MAQDGVEEPETPAVEPPRPVDPRAAGAETVSVPPPASAPAQDLADQRSIGPFTVVRVLGAGGMGKVYLARDTKLNRTVALKVMSADLAGEPDMKKRFLREAQTAAKLDHPHIVKVFEVGEAANPQGPGQPYIAMEYVEGTDLAKLLYPQGSSLPLREALEYVRQAAEALGYAHKQGLVHRDVKPANILVTVAGQAKLTDFGLARGVGGDASRLTKTGQVMGTPHYMSPEQWEAQPEKIQAPADQYSVGAMLYEVLTGDPPFADTRDMRVLAAKALGQDPPAPRTKNPKVHPDLETIALKALEKEPEKRYASCEDLAKDLGRFLAGETIAARPAGRIERATKWARRNRQLAGALAAAALAVLVLVGVLAMGVWNRHAARNNLRSRLDSLQSQARKQLADGDYETAGKTHDELAAKIQEARASALLEADAAEGGLELGRKQLQDRLQAEHRLAEAQEARSAYDAAAEESRKLQGELQAERAQVPVWADRTAKAHLYQLDAGARRAEGALLQAERRIVLAYETAIQADRAVGAAGELAAFYWERFLATEAGAAGAAEDYRGRCLALDHEFNLGYAARFQTGGRVSFDTLPSSADLYLFRYEPDGPRLLPRPFRPAGLNLPAAVPADAGDAGSPAYPALWGPANWVGTTPLAGLELSPGSYLFLIRSLGKRDTRYPVFIRRGHDWKSEKDGRPVPVPLYTDAEIGQDFVYIPPGPFLMGEPKELGTSSARESVEPWVDGFFMGRFEVSTAEYVEFLNDRAFHAADGLTGFRDAQDRLRRVPRAAPHDQSHWLADGEDIRAGWDLSWPIFAVSWEDAEAYARWKNSVLVDPADPATWSLALAADEEWEKSARGVDGRAFPWGTAFDAALCLSPQSFPEGERPNPQACGYKPDDESVYGVRDLGSSVREWCEDWEMRDEFRLVRSGSWNLSDTSGFRCAYRDGGSPATVRAYLGFRLVRRAPRTPR